MDHVTGSDHCCNALGLLRTLRNQVVDWLAIAVAFDPKLISSGRNVLGQPVAHQSNTDKSDHRCLGHGLTFLLPTMLGGICRVSLYK
jgi:hypothetical protein